MSAHDDEAASLLDDVVRAYARYAAQYGDGPAVLRSSAPMVSVKHTAAVRLTLADGEQYVLTLMHILSTED